MQDPAIALLPLPFPQPKQNDKYLGGVASHSEKYVYAVPGRATRILRIDTATDELDYLPQTYPPDNFKWLRGVSCPPTPSHPRGVIVCLPCCRPTFLKIVPPDVSYEVDIPLDDADAEKI